jgi:hypothetical protein
MVLGLQTLTAVGVVHRNSCPRPIPPWRQLMRGHRPCRTVADPLQEGAWQSEPWRGFRDGDSTWAGLASCTELRVKRHAAHVTYQLRARVRRHAAHVTYQLRARVRHHVRHLTYNAGAALLRRYPSIARAKGAG